MPANYRVGRTYCQYCNAVFLTQWQAEHAVDSVHIANVKKFKRSPMYRNRQGELPFSPTLHDPPTLR